MGLSHKFQHSRHRTLLPSSSMTQGGPAVLSAYLRPAHEYEHTIMGILN